MPIIGIVARPSDNKKEKYDYVSDNLRIAVIKSGGIPLAILSTDKRIYELDKHIENKLDEETKTNLDKVLSLCDGIIFQGGSKFYPTDKYIAKYVIENDIPALGICLGMQLLNHVDNHEKSILIKIDKHLDNNKYVHEIDIFKDTLLSNILNKEKIKVNSRHRLAILKLNNFKVCAKSKDKLIESIYYPGKRFILGVQFHPEDMYFYDENARLIFKRFIEECQNVR